MKDAAKKTKKTKTKNTNHQPQKDLTMYSVRVFDHCPEFGGETILLNYPTIEEALHIADRERDEATACGLKVSVSIIKQWED